MIRRFQLRFIGTVLTVALAIIAVLSLVITGSVETEIIKRYDIALVDMRDNIFGDVDVFAAPNDHIMTYCDEYLFAVRYIEGYGFCEVDFSDIINLEPQLAEKIAKAAFATELEKGTVEEYRFRAFSEGEGLVLYVFASLKSNNIFIDVLDDIVIFAAAFIFLITAGLSIPISKNAAELISEQLEDQREFITNASHDLKTPVSVISANMDVLSLTDPDNQWVQSTKKQAKYMKTLINNIITTSKLMEKGFSVPFERFNFSEAMADVIESYVEPAHSANYTFTANIQPNIICNGNEFYCRQLAAILCDNAVKYSTENSKIELSIRKIEGYIYLNMTNNRDPEQHIETDKLFDRFYRGDKSRSSEKHGNGLGLSMAKSVAELHGGSIEAYCKTDDTITFSVILKG
ncbi:MAG: HAMP domain-containing histidine kinase [Ruminococcaceae bacterium]|nr:HAMP domain-containing histidine kinase [Oscillospiraceae bacterium]